MELYLYRPVVIMAGCVIKHRYNFIFTYLKQTNVTEFTTRENVFENIFRMLAVERDQCGSVDLKAINDRCLNCFL